MLLWNWQNDVSTALDIIIQLWLIRKNGKRQHHTNKRSYQKIW